MGLFSLLTFSWANGPVRQARKGVQLSLDKLYFPATNKTEAVFDTFNDAWNEQVASMAATPAPISPESSASLKNGSAAEQLPTNGDHAKPEAAKPEAGKHVKRSKAQADGKVTSRPLLRVLLRTHGKHFFIGGLCKLTWSCFVITGAFYFVRSLIQYVTLPGAAGSNPRYSGQNWTGYALSAGFFGFATIWGLALQRMGYMCMTTGVKVRSALLTAVTRKAIGISKLSPDHAADIVAFVANDIGKVYDAMQEFHYLWTAPLEAIAILSLLASLMSFYVLPGVGVVALVLFIQYYFGYRVAVNMYANSKNTHARTGVIQEALPSIKLVKYYGWERHFETKIAAIRAIEAKYLNVNAFMKTVNITMTFCVPPLTAFVCFATYEFNFKRLTGTVAFTTLSLFNILRIPLVVLPKALRAVSEGSAAVARIEEFLLAAIPHEQKQHQADAVGISIENGVFQYEGEQSFKLKVPKFTVAPGEVVAIVGRVGSGKSSLIQALLGSMDCLSGTCQIGGKIAYVPQTAWIQNLSIRDNILFGTAYDEARYREVIETCALELDLKMLPQGDGSFAGLRGMNLSGGQRQRVNLGRAVYFGADTLLLDSPLSAVDHHTAEHIFKHVIHGVLKDKAVVLVTHKLCFLRRCHKVAIVDGGEVQYFGPFNATAQDILARHLPVPSGTAATELAKRSDDLDESDAAPKAKLGPSAIEPIAVTKFSMGPSWVKYIRSGKGWKLALAIIIAAISIGTRQASDFWIRFWVEDRLKLFNSKTEYGQYATKVYSGVYIAFTFLFFTWQMIRSTIFQWWAIGAACCLHDKMLHRVLNTPMAFFLAKPVGELLNSFSSDQDKADEAMPDTLHFAGVYFFVMLATSVTVCINIPEFAAFVAVLAFVTFVMIRLYLPAATQVKKMRADTAGRLVGLTAEVLEGLPVIQAFAHERVLTEEFTRQTDTHHVALYNAESLNLWISFYTDFYGAVLVLAVSMFAVSQKSRGSAVVGLAFSNTIQLLVFYTWTVRLVTEAISLSSSIEQLTWLAYVTPIDGQDDVNNEGQALESDVKWSAGKTLEKVVVRTDPDDGSLPAAWPTNGAIAFEAVTMRYRPSARLALSGVTFSVAHAEKVGIVGRTGSGKSTLLLVLFRMFDLAGGRVLVDGVDTATISLRRARLALSVIPQEPVMFTGTLRENLDPYGRHEDSELLELLASVGLQQQADAVGGLGGAVSGTGGGDWSLGQTQLICLVRAALNKVPIVCMDEATAAMDPHTEAHVLEVADRLFANRTVLTIAHRLDAVIKADKVVVMDQGKVAEMGAPSTLLQDRGTFFSRLVDTSGPDEAALLRHAAAEHFQQWSLLHPSPAVPAEAAPSGPPTGSGPPAGPQ